MNSRAFESTLRPFIWLVKGLAMTAEEALKHISALVRDVHAQSKPGVFWPTIEAVQGLVRKVEAEQAATRKRVRKIVSEAAAKGAA